MARIVALLGILAAGAGAAGRGLDAEHPISGVITLLEELAETATGEGKEEAKTYQKYVDWCTESKGTLNTAITEEKTKIAELESNIESLTNTISATEADIAYLEKQLEEQNNAAAVAKKARDEKHALYTDGQDNFEETIEAVDTAVVALKSAESKNEFLQLGSGGAASDRVLREVKKAAILSEIHMSKKERRGVKAFLQVADGEDPPDHKSEFHSGNVEAEFEEMEEDFKVDKGAAMEDETHANNEYNLAKQARDAAIDAAKAAKVEKESGLADAKSEKASAVREKGETEKSLLADSQTLDSTTKDCETTRQQFVERTNMRNGEIESMKMAVKILEKVTKVRNPDEHEIPARLMQVDAHFDYGMADDVLAFVQERQHRHHHHGHHKRGVHHKGAKQSRAQLTKDVEALLRQAANVSHAVHKAALQQLAGQLATYEGPFDQLKAMIQKMVFHLSNEQTEEDQHKQWCDMELSTNTENKDDTDQKLRDYTQKVDALDAEVAELNNNIADNEAKVNEIHEYMKEETALRATNHKEIEATVKDAADAQSAIAQATQVLTKFYKDSGALVKEPWEFVQVKTARDVELPDNPATWDSSYTGVTDPSSGDSAVLELLGKVNEKFAKMEATARVQDAEDQKNFDQDMQDKKIELSQTEMDSTMKAERKASLEDKSEGFKEARKHTDVELGAVTAYLKDLEPACSEGDSTYDDRKKARKEEMEALRKAQTILEEAFREQ